jgi:hypothetical protein
MQVRVTWNSDLAYVSILFWNLFSNSLYRSAMATVIPPGLEGNLVEVSSGGGEDWMSFQCRKFYTNAFVVCEGKV